MYHNDRVAEGDPNNDRVAEGDPNNDRMQEESIPQRSDAGRERVFLNDRIPGGIPQRSDTGRDTTTIGYQEGYYPRCVPGGVLP